MSAAPNQPAARHALAMLTALVTLTGATRSYSGPLPEQACQAGRYNAFAKYAACEQKAIGKWMAGGEVTKYQQAVSKCRAKYSDTWTKLQAKASGTGATCDTTRFIVGSGTVMDNLTGLQWEQKTDDGGIHDKDNTYGWSVTLPLADGSVFTTFLATLNGGSCFAGHCDWRLPTRTELQTILAEPSWSCTTCIDEGVFGSTAASYYWSSTTYATLPDGAWAVHFDNGAMGHTAKSSLFYGRAVRGGL